MKKELKVIEMNTTGQEACCEPAYRPTLNQTQAEHSAKLFAVLADETRLTILNLLAESRGEVCVCDITEIFKQGQPTISHHLKVLRDAGLITGDKRGKWVYYSLVPNRLEEIKTVLDHIFKLPVPV